MKATCIAAPAPKYRMRGTRLDRLWVGLAFALVPVVASAGVLNPGDREIVFEGDPVESWTGYQAELTLGPGALSDSVQLRESLFRMHMGTVAGTSFLGGVHLINSVGEIEGTITHDSRPGLVTGATLGSGLPVSDVSVYNSTISGYGRGVHVDGGAAVTLSSSRVNGALSSSTTRGVGIYLNAGTLAIRSGSAVVGATTGLEITQNTFGGGITGGATIVVDASRVEGTSAHAILVHEGADPVVTDITVRNGSTLVAGNGILLEVQDAATATFNVASSALAGNIVTGSAATTHVNLSNNASITGVFDNVSSVMLAGGARWELGGDSGVGSLALNGGGMVALGAGTAFNTLTVAGDFVGAGGTVLFNTVLDGDGSASDRLIVHGDTRGQANVAVNNRGGAGAQSLDGITLIEVGGASDGVFTLVGRAVAGQYEYFLHKGRPAAPPDGNWYLRSELPAPPDPCLADPSLPGCAPVVPPDPDPCLADPGLPGCTPVVPPDPDPCLADPGAPGCVVTLPDQCLIDPTLPQCLPPEPVPVLRPEPGAYLANQSAAIRMFSMRAHDRTGGTARGLSERGAWARVSRNQADYGVIGDQLSVNGDTDTLQVGTDVVSWGERGRGQFGVMLGSGRASQVVTSRLTGYSAKGKVDGQALGIYATWLQNPSATTGLYVDAWANHAQFSNSVEGDALNRERYDSSANSASFEAGYGVQVVDGERVAMFVEPQLQLSYTWFSADRHIESNGTVIDGSDADGLSSRIGVRFFGHATTGVGNRVQPFVTVNWIHESGDNRLRFDGERLAGGVSPDRYEAKAGASLQLGRRWSAWGDLGLQRGGGGYRDLTGQLGLRSSW